MKRFHITYWKNRETHTLTGLTVESSSIIGAIQIAASEGIDFNDIKYILEL